MSESSLDRNLPRLQSIKLCFDNKNIEFTIPNATEPSPIYFINDMNESENNNVNQNAVKTIKLPLDVARDSPIFQLVREDAWNVGNSNTNGKLYDEPENLHNRNTNNVSSIVDEIINQNKVTPPHMNILEPTGYL